MCTNPSHVWVQKGPKYEKMPVRCGQCRQCRLTRMNDYIGRLLCEANQSDHVLFTTLTYAPRDDLSDKILTPRHFQDYIRALRDRYRKEGVKIRYLVVGEYGERKGRAHFHAILFFTGGRPDWPDANRHWIPEWPHGHVQLKWNPGVYGMRYVCKYLLKEQSVPGQDDKYQAGRSWFSMSKKPALGSEFFRKKAERHARMGVWPRSFEYDPPNGLRGIKYYMTGATRRDFIARLIELMGHPVMSTLNEWVRRSVEKVQRWLWDRNEADHSFTSFDDDFLERQKTQNQHRNAEIRHRDLDRIAIFRLWLEYGGSVPALPVPIPLNRRKLERGFRWLKEQGKLPERLHRFPLGCLLPQLRPASN